MKNSPDEDQEITAIGAVYGALRQLKPDAQKRVIEYIRKKLSLTLETSTEELDRERDESSTDSSSKKDTVDHFKDTVEEDLEGVSPVAKKWMRRSGFQAN